MSKVYFFFLHSNVTFTLNPETITGHCYNFDKLFNFPVPGFKTENVKWVGHFCQLIKFGPKHINQHNF